MTFTEQAGNATGTPQKMVFTCLPPKAGHQLGQREPSLGHLSWRYLPTAPIL